MAGKEPFNLGVLWGIGPRQRELPWRSPPHAALMRIRRWKAERAIEWLIEGLDIEDGDPDLEPDADREPSLSWSTVEAARNGPWISDSGLGVDNED